MIDVASVVRLAPKVRLKFDRHAQGYMLLYPERGLALSATAADVLTLCTEPRQVAAIVEQIVSKYGEPNRGAITEDVLKLLRDMADKGLLREVAS
jgi:coenzyme PQQ biosynthesis protein PqqD